MFSTLDLNAFRYKTKFMFLFTVNTALTHCSCTPATSHPGRDCPSLRVSFKGRWCQPVAPIGVHILPRSATDHQFDVCSMPSCSAVSSRASVAAAGSHIAVKVGCDTTEPVRDHQKPYLSLQLHVQLLLFIASPLVYKNCGLDLSHLYAMSP